MNKKNKQYITLLDGIHFRKISKIMSNAGYRMNHATARNVLMSALNTFIFRVASEIGIFLPSEKIDFILQNKDLHNSFVDILFKAYGQMQIENREKRNEI
jgi:hypothetical protein